MSTKKYDVVLYGATGFTGKLIAHELSHLGMSFLLAGRSASKLSEFAATLPGSPPTEAVSVDEHHRMAEIFSQGKVLISAAGPFGAIGMDVARAALAGGCHYLDTTGATGFMRQMAEELDEPAKKAGVAMSPAMGFDIIPGDLGAWLAACSLGKDGKHPAITKAEVIYNVHHPAITRGTFKSMLEGRTKGESKIWENGSWRSIGFMDEGKDFTFPGESKEKFAALTELPETLTLSRALGAQTVLTYMLSDKLQVGFLKGVEPVGKALLNSPVGEFVNKLVDQLPEGPDMKARTKTTFDIYSHVWAKDGREASVVVSGGDPYGLTGEALAVYAHFMCQKGYKRKGVLSPCQVVEPNEALSAIKRFPLTVKFL